MFVLYNAAHSNSSIQSTDKKAWIRILGFFSTKEEALQHASTINLKNKQKQEIRIAPLHTFKMILKDKITNDSIDIYRKREADKHALLLSTHIKFRNQAFKQTQENAEFRKMGSSFSILNSILKETSTIKSNQVNDNLNLSNFNKSSSNILPNNIETTELLPLSRDDEIRLQRFAAISIIPDYEVLSIKAKQFWEDEEKVKQEYTKQKNEIISKKMKEGFKLPSFETLIKEFIETTPPPNGYDCYGKKINTNECFITQNETELLKETETNQTLDLDTNVTTWLQMRDVAIEDALFKFMNIDKPELTEFKTEITIEEEPAVMFLAFSDREDEMETIIQKIVDTDSSMKNYDIACVAMYEWISLDTLNVTEDTKNSIRYKYRDSQLTKLHEARKSHAEQAETLEKEGATVITL
jgi:hypothetical protein